ncbi:MAG: twin-arginine translocase TatA/TatE family subunit [Capsulimonadaceae bacterium]|nr:twin-arginine translocase TatA/TatE family subunit [Capsulimonadaceae bacterium]
MIQPIFGNLWMLETPFGLLVVAFVVVLLFGGNKLAGFGKSLGEGMREFKKAISESDDSSKAQDAKKDEASAVKPDKGE